MTEKKENPLQKAIRESAERSRLLAQSQVDSAAVTQKNSQGTLPTSATALQAFASQNLDHIRPLSGQTPNNPAILGKENPAVMKFIRLMEKRLPNAMKMKKIMLKQQIRKAKYRCEECNGYWHATIGGSRHHIMIRCDGTCNFVFME